jgi:preprotein translocase subunit YajC
MFFISDAYAQTAAAPTGAAAIMQFAPFILMFVILYFLMIRPQMKRQKELKAMLAALKKGDEIASIGGLVGKITKADDNFVTIVTGSGTEVTLQRGAVQSILPPGSLK